MREEEAWLLPHFGQELVKVVRSGPSFARPNALARRRAGEEAVFAVVDELALLSLLHLFDEEAQLFLDLIEGLAVEVRYARLYVENGGHRLEKILARVLDIVDERFGQVRILAARRAAFDVGLIVALVQHAIQAKNTGLDRSPVKKADEP